jgi:ribosomal protein S18 acetylase RimI-like enzyme
MFKTSAWPRRQSVLTMPHHCLVALVVRPIDRGQGHASRLLCAALAAGQASQALSYITSQMPEHMHFYRRAGFRLMGQYPIDRSVPGPTT